MRIAKALPWKNLALRHHVEEASTGLVPIFVFLGSVLLSTFVSSGAEDLFYLPRAEVFPRVMSKARRASIARCAAWVEA